MAAAAALEEAWKKFRPDDVVERVDLIKFFSPLHRKLYTDGYVQLVERAPELWGYVFGKTDSLKATHRMNKFRRLFPSRSRARFAEHVKKFNPDIVLCTHYSPLETLGAMRQKALSKKSSAGHAQKPPFVVSVVTDFEAHALWMEPSVDLYCVAAEETKARLLARGAKAENAVATGIPIAGKFSAPISPDAVRKQLGLRDDLPTLLVLSGGFGMGPVAKILGELDKVSASFQTVVVTGRNEELRRDLATQDRKHPTHVIGFASNMHELMAIAELIITKPGGLTSSEALAMGKPLFILNPIPGQEAANSDFLLERGAAAKANRVEDLAFRITQLLGSKKLKEMATAAKALGNPLSAQAACRETLARYQSGARD